MVKNTKSSSKLSIIKSGEKLILQTKNIGRIPTVKAKVKPTKNNNSTKSPSPKPPRRRPSKPYYFNVLYPKQKDIKSAIINKEDTRLIFKEHLVKANLFNQDEEIILLVPPISRQRKRPKPDCKNPAELLDKLCLILYTYFLNQYLSKGDVNKILSLEFRCSSALGDISICLKLFSKIGIPEKSINDVLKKIKRWFKYWINYRQSLLSSPKFDDLKYMIFIDLKERTNFSERQIFYFIARLWKYFGFATGSEQKIFNRLKFEYYSANGKQSVNDLQKLRNTSLN